MDWTAEKAKLARRTLAKWYGQAAQASAGCTPFDRAVAALADDLNTHGALAECHALSGADDFAGLRGTMELLGFFDGGAPSWVAAAEPNLGAFADLLRKAREAAMTNKNFAEVDRLKAAFIAAGVEVRMTRTEVELVAGEDFDPTKLESLK